MGGCHQWQESKPVRIPHKPVRQAADMRDFDPFLSSYLLLMTFAQSHFLIVIHTSMTTNTKKRDGRKAFVAWITLSLSLKALQLHDLHHTSQSGRCPFFKMQPCCLQTFITETFALCIGAAGFSEVKTLSNWCSIYLNCCPGISGSRSNIITSDPSWPSAATSSSTLMVPILCGPRNGDQGREMIEWVGDRSNGWVIRWANENEWVPPLLVPPLVVQQCPPVVPL